MKQLIYLIILNIEIKNSYFPINFALIQ